MDLPVCFLKNFLNEFGWQSSCYKRPEKVKTTREPALPAIFRSAWRSKVGKCGAVLVNWSRAEQP